MFREHRRPRSLLGETAFVVVLGVALSFAANFFSPRGLSLTRDYFPAAEKAKTRESNTPAAPLSPSRDVESGKVAAAAAPAPARNETGVLSTDQALELFRNPEYAQQLIVFVDARDDKHYAEGHIPGAVQLDNYYPEKYLAEALPACQIANRVVVYCTGGQCEDSHSVARLLIDTGIPRERVSVYAGGITDWRARRLPVEKGARNSGDVTDAHP